MRPARTTCGSTSPTTARWSARPSGFAPTTTGPTQLCTSRRVRRSGPRRTSPSCGTTLRRGRPARANDAAEDRRALRGVLPATFARRTFARSMPRWVWQTSTGPGLGMHSSTVWLSGPLASEQRRNGATAQRRNGATAQRRNGTLPIVAPALLAEQRRCPGRTGRCRADLGRENPGEGADPVRPRTCSR